MEHLLLPLKVVLPILLQLGLGWFLHRKGALSAPFLQTLNALVFRLFLPVMMFGNISSGAAAPSVRLTAFAAVSVSALFLLLFLLVPLLEHENSRRGVLIQGIGRSNFAVFGYAIAAALCPPEKLGLAALMVAVVLPLYGVYSTVALELYAPGAHSGGLLRHIFFRVLKNPLVISGVLGLLFSVSGLRLPGPVSAALNSVGQAATPLSLIALGGCLDLGRLKSQVRPLILGVAGKLVVVPLIFLSLAALLGFRGTEFAVSLAIFASPTATASFTMTQQLGGDEDLAAGLVALSAIGAPASVSLFLLLFYEQIV